MFYAQFKRLGILTVPSLYIYSILMFVVRNRNIYQINNNTNHIYTRLVEKLHVSSARLSSIERGVLYSSVMVYNNLPQNIRMTSGNVKSFKCTLKNFLILNAFYSIEEYISANHV
jgi:hypothetical protein